MNEQQIADTKELTLQLVSLQDESYNRGFKAGNKLLRQQNEELKSKIVEMRREAMAIADFLDRFQETIPESNAIQRLRKMAE